MASGIIEWESCPTWTLIKLIEKKLDGNCTRMLWAILNKSWKQQSTKQQLYGHLPPISKTIKISQTRDAWQCWRSKDELIRPLLADVQVLNNQQELQQLSMDTGSCLEDLLEVMDDRDEWQERVRETCVSSTRWW